NRIALAQLRLILAAEAILPLAAGRLARLALLSQPTERLPRRAPLLRRLPPVLGGARLLSQQFIHLSEPCGVGALNRRGWRLVGRRLPAQQRRGAYADRAQRAAGALVPARWRRNGAGRVGEGQLIAQFQHAMQITRSEGNRMPLGLARRAAIEQRGGGLAPVGWLAHGQQGLVAIDLPAMLALGQLCARLPGLQLQQRVAAHAA